MEPLLKWPGGKRLLIPQIAHWLPKTWKSYFEPFAGGAALFFWLEPSRAVLSDSNSELIETYAAVRDCPEKVIGALKRMRNSEQDYYCIRDSAPRAIYGRAARFIYLSTLAFNGIHRRNLNGKFNVPYGYKTHLNACNEDLIFRSSKALQAATLKSCDFEEAVAGAVEGDLVYFDPPYTVAHNNNGFIKYNASIFSWADQKRLAQVAESLAKRGCQVLVSNAGHSSLRKLYPQFEGKGIRRYSIIASKREHRREITERLFRSRLVAPARDRVKIRQPSS